MYKALDLNEKKKRVREGVKVICMSGEKDEDILGWKSKRDKRDGCVMLK